MEVVGRTWKSTTLKHLLADAQRFGELSRAMPGHYVTRTRYYAVDSTTEIIKAGGGTDRQP